jgi:hypothetical protein
MINTIVDIEDLRKLPEVMWDRMGPTMAFGWVDREDQYKDFVVLTYSVESVHYYTSAPWMHDIIEERLGFDKNRRLSCTRVEDIFPELSNCIRLKK